MSGLKRGPLTPYDPGQNTLSEEFWRADTYRRSDWLPSYYGYISVCRGCFATAALHAGSISTIPPVYGAIGSTRTYSHDSCAMRGH